MKTYTYSLLLAAAATGMAFGQTAYTKPVGYTTQSLPANTTTLVGFNVLKSSVATGQLTGVSGADLTDTNVNFGTLLTAGKMYTVEITSGTAAGTVQEFTAWSGSTITLPAAIAGIAATDKYSVRPTPTLQETFPIGFLAGSFLAGTADKVWVPNGVGGYTKYWYKTNAPIGWRTTTTGSDDTGAVAADVPLVYIDALFIEKKGVAKDLVISGEVKTTGSNTLITAGFNLVGINPPAGSTLFTAGLSGDIAGSFLAGSADKVWVQGPTGTYTKYWYKTNAPIGWRTTTSGSDDTGAVAADVNLPSSILIQKASGSKIITLDVPASYSNL